MLWWRTGSTCKGRSYGSTFEKVEAKQIFRIPFVMGRQENVLRTSQQVRDGEGCCGGELEAPATDTWGLEKSGAGIYELDSSLDTDPRNQKHFQLLRQTQGYWQAYDAFARVSLSVGTSQLVTMLSYFVLGFFLMSNHATVAACLVVVIFSGIAVAMIYLDMSLSGFESNVAVFLAIFGPLATAACAASWLNGGPGWLIQILMPLVYLVSCGRMVFLFTMCAIQELDNGVMLPTGFRAVLYTDVFGWIKRKNSPKIQSMGAPALETPGVV